MGFGSVWGGAWGGDVSAEAIAADGAPPFVVDVYPLPGSIIAADTPITFSVRDDVELDFVGLTITTPSAAAETAFSGAFAPAYAELSAVDAQPPLRADFVLLRADGWSDSPTLRIQAVDAAGLEAEVVFEWVLVKTEPAAAAPAVRRSPGRLALTRPFRRNNANDFNAENPTQARRARVVQLLGTKARSPRHPGEIRWDPEYGSRLHELRHRSGPGVDALAELYVRMAFEKWEPTLAVGGVVMLPIDSRAKTTRTFRVTFRDLVQGDEDSVEV